MGGVIAMLSCYAIAMVLIAVYWVYMIYLNKKKEAQQDAWEKAHPEGADLLEDWHDQTDFENPRFRYLY